MRSRPGAIRRSYERGAAGYDRAFRDLQWPKYRTMLGGDGRRLRAWMTRGRVLELGCGTGLLGEFATAGGLPEVRWTGVDFAHPLLVRARPRGITPVQAAIERLPFRDATFAAVLSFTVLALHPDTTGDAAALGELARVLAPGGAFVVTVLEASAERMAHAMRVGELEVEARLACGQDVGFVGRRRPC